MEWINANAGLLVFIAIVLLIALGVILTFDFNKSQSYC